VGPSLRALAAAGYAATATGHSMGGDVATPFTALERADPPPHLMTARGAARGAAIPPRCHALPSRRHRAGANPRLGHTCDRRQTRSPAGGRSNPAVAGAGAAAVAARALFAIFNFSVKVKDGHLKEKYLN